MTHIYSKITDYKLNNKGRAKGLIDLFELTPRFRHLSSCNFSH